MASAWASVSPAKIFRSQSPQSRRLRRHRLPVPFIRRYRNERTTEAGLAPKLAC
jgi:hypothetical protein